MAHRNSGLFGGDMMIRQATQGIVQLGLWIKIEPTASDAVNALLGLLTLRMHT